MKLARDITNTIERNRGYLAGNHSRKKEFKKIGFATHSIGMWIAEMLVKAVTLHLLEIVSFLFLCIR